MKKIHTCIICGKNKFKNLYSSKDRMFDFSGGFSVKKCQTCSLVFLDPQPSQHELKKYYPSQNYYSYNQSNKKGLFELLREYLVRHYYSPNVLSTLISTIVHNVPAMPRKVFDGKILDIGCGAGDTLLLLKNLGWNTFGVDMDVQAIKNAKKRGLTNITLGTYKNISKYPNNYFDAIRMYHVIEHIDDPKDCLKLIYKKLKKNGELIIGTPNIRSFAGNVFASRWYNLDSPRHLFLFSPQTLQKLLIKNKFKVKEVSYCSGGGIVGSIQYVITDIFKVKIDLIHNTIIILLFYPLEWLLDKIGLGDVFVIRAKITNE